MSLVGENERKYDEDEKGISLNPYGGNVGWNAWGFGNGICGE